MSAQADLTDRFLHFRAAGADGLLPMRSLEKVAREAPPGLPLVDLTGGHPRCVLLLYGTQADFALGVEEALALREVAPEDQFELPAALRAPETEKLLLGVARLPETGRLCCVTDGPGFEGWTMPVRSALPQAAPRLPFRPLPLLLLTDDRGPCAVPLCLLREIVPQAQLSPVPPLSSRVFGLMLWRGRALAVMGQSPSLMMCIAGAPGQECAWPVTAVGEERTFTPEALAKEMAEGLRLLCTEEADDTWR